LGGGLTVRLGVIGSDVQLDVGNRFPAERAAHGAHVLAAIVIDDAVVGLTRADPTGVRTPEGECSGQFRRSLPVHFATEIEQVHVTGALLRSDGYAAGKGVRERKVDPRTRVDA